MSKEYRIISEVKQKELKHFKYFDVYSKEEKSIT
jgi:hypothetical protein